MKFSESWLRQWVNPSMTTDALVSQITMAGLEVDSVEAVAQPFSGVVVAEVVQCDVHPNADSLHVCQVCTGQEVLQVVCGAPNVRVGLKVAFATIGARLGSDFVITKAILRKVDSYGMLCSERELGLSDNDEGILELASDAPLGKSLRDYLLLDDVAIEVDLTPNRADCLSILGLAREVAALNQIAFKMPSIETHVPQHEQTLPVDIINQNACPIYRGRVLIDINMNAATPIWMVERLRRSGIRSIDPVVDITNYVMIELGQPMHAFDMDILAQKLVVRFAQEGEQLILLDGQTLTLSPKDLVIADSEKVLALAGIMGGKNSGVSSTTTRIFLESAFFDPVTLAGKARSFGLHTESSHRFERGVDPSCSLQAIERATALLIEICGAKPGPIIEKNTLSNELRCITLTTDAVNVRLGTQLDDHTIDRMLVALGFETEESAKGMRTIRVPTWRFDLSEDVDLIEEVARLYGYENIPSTVPSLDLKPQPYSELRVDPVRLADRLVSLGYQEAITYSFVSNDMQSLLFPDLQALALVNPISSEMSVMRVSLWPGLIKTMVYNLNRQVVDLRLFELGMCFIPSEKDTLQKNYLSGLITGRRQEQGWFQNDETVDFYDIKGDLESLLGLAKGVTFEITPTEHSALHPGQCAKIEKDGCLVGYLGAVHPRIMQHLGLKQSAYVFELDIEQVCQSKLTEFAPLSKFPVSARDLSIVVEEGILVSELMSSVKEVAGEDLKDVNLFDIYRGQGIEQGCKSLAIGLTWQNPSRTLKDDEVNHLVELIIGTLQKRFGAVLRG